MRDEAEAAASRQAAEAEARRKADADAAARQAAAQANARAEAEAETRRRTDAAAAAARQAQVAQAAPQSAPAGRARTATSECTRSISDAASSVKILFDTASATITAYSGPSLGRLAAAIRACPSTRMRIEGHTDAQGDARRNQLLSERRARAVTDYMVKAGIEPSRLASIGLGQTHPLAPNTTTANKRLNRRIAFVIENP